MTYPQFPDTAKGRAEQRSFDKHARATIRSASQPDLRSRADAINRIETETKGDDYEDRRICEHEN